MINFLNRHQELIADIIFWYGVVAIIGSVFAIGFGIYTIYQTRNEKFDNGEDD